MREKPKVGDRLYSLNVGNAARHRKQKLTPVIVTKVGRRYFTATREDCIDPESKWGSSQFRLSDWVEHSNYSVGARLFESPQKWEEEKEVERVCREIEKEFAWGRNSLGLSVQELREVKRIIDSAKARRP